MKRQLSFAVLATLGAFALLVLAGVPLPYLAQAQSSPSVAVSLSSDTVEEGTAIAVTMSFSGLESDADTATKDYVFRADVVGTDECEDQAGGYGLSVDRYMHKVHQDPETRTGTISADCPAGDYTLEASISSPDGVELASARASFSVAEPEEEEDDPPDSVQQQTRPVDITLDSQNGNPRGVWSDGTTVWVVDAQRHKLYAYTLSSGARDSGKDIALDSANRNAEGVWSDGTTIWVADDSDEKLYAYTLSGGARNSGKEFGLASKPSDGTFAADDNSRPAGVWSDGTTIWVVDDTDDKLYAYTLSNGSRDSGKEFSVMLGLVQHPGGIWSDGTTMWVVYPRLNKAHAYTISGGSRNSGLDLSLRISSNNWGAWSDGTTMWVGNTGAGNKKLFHHQLPGTSTDASLSALGLSGVTLSPAFAGATTIYTASVYNSVTSTTVTAEQTDDDAGVVITPVDADLSAEGHQVSLDVGSNVVRVKVTAEDGTTTRTYTVTVTRAANSATVVVSAPQGVAQGTRKVEITWVDTQDCTDGYKAYTAIVNTSGSVLVALKIVDTTTGTADVITATYANLATINQIQVWCGERGSGRMVGEVAMTLDPDNEDRPIPGTYTTAAADSAEPPALSALTVSAGTLTPAFAGGTLEYAVPGLAYGNNRITVTTTADADATVSYEDGAGNALSDVDAATAGDQFDLAVGENTIKVKVTEGDASQTYTLALTRAKPVVGVSAAAATAGEGDALTFTVTRTPAAGDPLALTVRVAETGDLVPAAGEGDRTVTIAADATGATLTVATGADDGDWEEHSTVSVTAPSNAGYTLGSGAASASTLVEDDDFPAATAALRVSPTTVGEPGTAAVTVTVTTNADQQPHGPGGTLRVSSSDLTASAGSDYDAFSQSYTLDAAGFSAVTILGQRWQRVYTGTVTVKDDDAQESAETFNVALTKSGAPQVTLALPAAFVVTIPANDAPTASSDASLSALALSGVTLSPDFAGATTGYTASVYNSVTSTTVTATPNHAAAKVVITPVDADLSAEGYQVSLDVGSNVVSVKVTAEDGTTTRTYTVTVTRAANSVTVVVSAPDGVTGGDRKFEITWVDTQECTGGHSAYVGIINENGVVIGTTKVTDDATDTADVITATYPRLARIHRRTRMDGVRTAGGGEVGMWEMAWAPLG